MRLTPDEYAQKIRDVAYPIAIRLQGTSPVSKKFIRSLMDEEFEGTNSQGAWKRKDSYEAGELAMVMLFWGLSSRPWAQRARNKF